MKMFEPLKNKPTDGPQRSDRNLRIYLLVSFLLHAAVLVVRLPEAYGIGSILGFSGSKLVKMWPYFLGVLLSGGGMVLLATRWQKKLVNWARFVFRGIAWLRWVNWIFLPIPILFFGYLHLTGLLLPFLSGLSQIWLFGHLSLLSAIFLRGTRKIKPLEALAVSFSINGVLLWVIYFIPDVQTYPLSLGWSETSRYYYASLFFSRAIYGQSAPLSSLHPTRYLMQSLPFIVPSLPLWFHRLWQVLLWLGVTWAGGVALSRRLDIKNTWVRLAVSAWFFLFCFQGPVYYHLMVVIIIVLLGFDKDRLWRSFLIVVAASLWAGISRVNWFPVPGMLAVALYALETPHRGKNFWQYWRWPVLVVVLGMAAAFGAQAGYAAISGNPPEVFASSFNSPLFWYRLFPNEAYGPGIINLLVTAVFPLMAVILWRLFFTLRSWHFLRLLALFSILLALLAAGLVVSSKIGGGDNLHNMDAFMVFFAIIGAYFALDAAAPDWPARTQAAKLPVVLMAVAFLIPLVFAVDALRPLPNLDSERAWSDIAQVQKIIDENLSEGGEILFIHQRHLLTFDMIRGVSLVPDYEKVFLMEMAMSGNEDYLEKFWQDLEDHRFDLIISEHLAIVVRPASDIFGEENNVWVTRVAEPLVDHYEISWSFEDSDMYILTPRQTP